MKRIFALMLAVVLTLGIICLTGCGSENETANDNKPDYSVTSGEYHCDEFIDDQDYINFIAAFDYESNEILSVCHDRFYFYVTWKEKDNATDNNTSAESTTISVKEILQNNDENYIVIANDDTVTMVPKTVAEFIVSTESNLLILEKTDATIVKATFCITQEMLTGIK